MFRNADLKKNQKYGEGAYNCIEAIAGKPFQVPNLYGKRHGSNDSDRRSRVMKLTFPKRYLTQVALRN